MLFRKITAGYSENHEEERNTLWAKCSVLDVDMCSVFVRVKASSST
jgi:hypothetical protein